MTALDQPYGGGSEAGIERIRNGTDRLKGKSRMGTCHRFEEIGGHQQLGCELVCCTFLKRVTRSSLADVGCTTHKQPTAMVAPVSKLVGHGKPLPPPRASGVDSDNRLIGVSNNPRLTAVERPVTNLRTERQRDGFEVYFAWVGDAQIDKQLLSWST